MTQDQVIDATGGEVSKSSLNRWENGKAIGEPDKIRIAVLAMGADPREAAVALGLVTREEWGLPPAPAPVDVVLRDPARELADPKLTDAAKELLRGSIIGAMKYWRSQLGLLDVREPSAKERAKGKPVKRN